MLRLQQQSFHLTRGGGRLQGRVEQVVREVDLLINIPIPRRSDVCLIYFCKKTKTNN